MINFMISNYDNYILKKIQNKEYDDEVKEFIQDSLNWYKDNADELLKK